MELPLWRNFTVCLFLNLAMCATAHPMSGLHYFFRDLVSARGLRAVAGPFLPLSPVLFSDSGQSTHTASKRDAGPRIQATFVCVVTQKRMALMFDGRAY